MSVAAKLGLGYGLVVLLLAAVLAAVVLSLERAAEASRRLAGASERLVLATTEQQMRLDRLRDSGLKYAITRDTGYSRQFREQAAAFDSSLTVYRARAETGREARAAAELDDAWRAFRGRWVPLEARLPSDAATGAADSPAADSTAAGGAGDAGGAAAGFDSAFVAGIDALRRENRDLTEATRESILSAVDRSSRLSRQSERYAWAGVATAVLLAGVIWVLLVRSISRALGALVAGTRRIADGDFGVRLDADREDEFGELADAFDGMAERLEELDRLKKDFLSKVSHDLKSPLATMREVHRFLLEGGAGELEEKQRDLLRRNEERGERLWGMITTLLDVARFEAEAVELSAEACDLAGVAEAVVRSLEPRFEVSGVALEVEAPDGAVVAEADAERVRQLIENLLENALAASSEGDTVTVEIRASPDGDGAAVLAVADRGPGVPEEEKEDVFDRFFQGGDRDRATGGTGLGLTLCRRIAQAHGGSIAVEDRAGGGAVFRVRLPRGGA